MNRFIFSAILTLFLFNACTSSSSLIHSSKESVSQIAWEKKSSEAPVEIYKRWRTSYGSHQVVRLNESEKPHRHFKHDLTVFMVKGKVRMHLGDRIFMAHAGDVIEIPKGTFHWAEKITKESPEAYTIFNPPFDGKDIVYES